MVHCSQMKRSSSHKAAFRFSMETIKFDFRFDEKSSISIVEILDRLSKRNDQFNLLPSLMERFVEQREKRFSSTRKSENFSFRSICRFHKSFCAKNVTPVSPRSSSQRKILDKRRKIFLFRAKLVCILSAKAAGTRPGPFASSRENFVEFEFRDGGCNQVKFVDIRSISTVFKLEKTFSSSVFYFYPERTRKTTMGNSISSESLGFGLFDSQRFGSTKRHFFDRKFDANSNETTTKRHRFGFSRFGQINATSSQRNSFHSKSDVNFLFQAKEMVALSQKITKKIQEKRSDLTGDEVRPSFFCFRVEPKVFLAFSDG